DGGRHRAFFAAVLMRVRMIMLMMAAAMRMALRRSARRMFVRVLRRRRAALAVHPARVAADVVLLLPDRHAMLHFIDDVAAREERLVPVTRARANPHREIADGETPDAMHASRMLDAEPLHRFGHDALGFLQRERLEGFVLEAIHLEAFVVIAHPALERCIAAAGRIVQHLRESSGLERLVA